MPEESEYYKFGVGTYTTTILERLAGIAEYEIYPITKFSHVIGYLSLAGENLYMTTCPSFTKPRADSTFSLYQVSFADFCDYSRGIKHTSKFGEVGFQYIYSRGVLPLVSGITTLQEALAILKDEVGAPLQ